MLRIFFYCLHSIILTLNVSLIRFSFLTYWFEIFYLFVIDATMRWSLQPHRELIWDYLWISGLWNTLRSCISNVFDVDWEKCGSGINWSKPCDTHSTDCEQWVVKPLNELSIFLLDFSTTCHSHLVLFYVNVLQLTFNQANHDCTHTLWHNHLIVFQFKNMMHPLRHNHWIWNPFVTCMQA